MTKHDLDRAMQACPFGKASCVFVDLGTCSVVNMWRYDHKSVGYTQSVHFYQGDYKAAGSRGGQTTKLRRKVHAVM